MRSALVLALLLTVPTAAGQVVDLLDVQVPERTMAERAWSATVTLQNRAGEARTVVLFGALYARDAAPCGPATEPSFRQFTHLVQERITLGAGETRTMEDWRQSYRRASVGASPEVMEWCAFVAEDEGKTIEYLDVGAVPLSVRGANARPTGSFSWSPALPLAAQDARFEAEGEDADGDPLSFSWDFGHANASGRRPALGQAATHSFYPQGRYVVTLTVSDGLEETTVAREVEVAPEPAPGDEERPVPLPLILPLAALAWAARARARRPRCR